VGHGEGETLVRIPATADDRARDRRAGRCPHFHRAAEAVDITVVFASPFST
jgi:hypothetical protein